MAVDLGSRDRIRTVTTLVACYVAVAVGTVAALLVLATTAPRQTTGHAWEHAWGHAVVVAVFAVLLPLRLRAARRGSAGARRAVPVVAGTLLVVNVVEAAIPGMFPAWMRVEMAGIAVLMLAIVVSSLRAFPRER